MLISTVTYPLALTKDSRNAGENKGENGENNDENKVLEIIRKTPSITQPLIAIETGFSTRKVNRIIASLRKKERNNKTHWENQRRALGNPIKLSQIIGQVQVRM